MKVVLIQLPSPWLISDREPPPLGVLYLAAALRRNKIEVQVADLTGVPEDRWYLPEGDIYGVSLVTPQVELAAKVISILRNRTQHQVKIIVGGPHVSAMPQWSLTNLKADVAFVGEADLAFPAYLLGKSFDKKIVRCDPPNLGDVGLPARDLIDIRSFHRQTGVNQYVSQVNYEGYMVTGRGCPFNCAFCAQKATTKGKWRPASLYAIENEIRELVVKYECKLIYFEDDTFNVDKKRLKLLCHLFDKWKLEWHCLCRADLVDKESLKLMAGSGCKAVTFGFESGSSKILRLMNKKTDPLVNFRAAAQAHDAGLKVRGQMIVGFPGEDEETISETSKFIKHATVDKWGLHAFVPLPGSKVWSNPEAFGLQIDKSKVKFSTGFHTIGKPGEWRKVWGDEEKVRGWLGHLRDIAQTKNIDRVVIN
jgi:radical SAM superfamily enzyme YgiQ (UPF0313 family)